MYSTPSASLKPPSGYSNTLSGTVLKEKQNLEYHANYSLADEANREEANKLLVQDMNEFILKAVQGVLTLV